MGLHWWIIWYNIDSLWILKTFLIFFFLGMILTMADSGMQSVGVTAPVGIARSLAASRGFLYRFFF